MYLRLFGAASGLAGADDAYASFCSGSAVQSQLDIALTILFTGFLMCLALVFLNALIAVYSFKFKSVFPLMFYFF
jgi:hypothetical protein